MARASRPEARSLLLQQISNLFLYLYGSIFEVFTQNTHSLINHQLTQSISSGWDE